MKKMLVLALAMFAMINTAHAAVRDGKPEAMHEREMREGKEHAEKLGHVGTEVLKVKAEINAAKLNDALNGDQEKALMIALNDAVLRKAAADVVAQSKDPKKAQLSKGLLEGISNLAKIDPKVRDLTTEQAMPEQKAEQAYTALVLEAGKMAGNWPDATQKNMVQFLEIANESIRSGKSVGQAMEFAKSELKRLAHVDIKLEDIKRLCKQA